MNIVFNSSKENQKHKLTIRLTSWWKKLNYKDRNYTSM